MATIAGKSSKGMSWTSNTGFILACIGAAVGLGNIWKFPYMVGTEGGSAFVLVYVISIFVITIPIAAAELLLGRMGRGGAVASIRKVATDNGRTPLFAAIGGVGVMCAFILLTFYAVVSGWVIAYVFHAGSGALQGITAQTSGDIFAELLADPKKLIACQLIFLGLIGVILTRNIATGLERANLVMMPALLVMLIVIAVYGVIAGDASAALTYLTAPNFSQISNETILRAIGQGFFSVGVGAAMLITYGSYINHKIDLGRAAIIIGVSDTVIALLAGFGIFAIVFGQNLDPAQGPGLIFVTLPIAFAQLPMGSLIATIFFVLVTFAALTSGLALAEVISRWAEDALKITRKTAISAMLAATFGVGLLSVFSFNIWQDVRLGDTPFLADKTLFDVKDYISSAILLPVGGLLVVLFACWGVPVAKARAAFASTPLMFILWLWLGRIVAPVGILWVFWANLTP